jgi:arsenate reductase
MILSFFSIATIIVPKDINKLKKMKVIFVCFHNSARSQMAEGLLRALYGDRYEVHSAGIEASQVDLRAVKAMSEIGIDISGQRSKR